jgi:hypothetical protein
MHSIDDFRPGTFWKLKPSIGVDDDNFYYVVLGKNIARIQLLRIHIPKYTSSDFRSSRAPGTCANVPVETINDYVKAW